MSFDPGDYSSEEVLALLADAEPCEIGRVLAAERRGLARPAVLSQFPPSLGGRTLPTGKAMP
ncbi:hypothetical protein OG874_00585 [Nocardia sp. NBC_00565]|uniref:hypothetical protein n=1 Tax=Nocardia sp. NBC_00565 TaxID=2975993 RepID=UPI002E816D55|nr:hypothetical protein [Nocardia sp. NBC_00565]WUC03752.1 hypothetical protein OG874_00585 [Nocardia sp. NBC_00565]